MLYHSHRSSWGVYRPKWREVGIDDHLKVYVYCDSRQRMHIHWPMGLTWSSAFFFSLFVLIINFHGELFSLADSSWLFGVRVHSIDQRNLGVGDKFSRWGEDRG